MNTHIIKVYRVIGADIDILIEDFTKALTLWRTLRMCNWHTNVFEEWETIPVINGEPVRPSYIR